MNTQPHSIRARFYHRPNTLKLPAFSNTCQGTFNGRGVMRKIIIDTNTTRLAHQLHAPFNPFKAIKCINRIFRQNPHMIGRGNTG